MPRCRGKPHLVHARAVRADLAPARSNFPPMFALVDFRRKSSGKSIRRWRQFSARDNGYRRGQFREIALSYLEVCARARGHQRKSARARLTTNGLSRTWRVKSRNSGTKYPGRRRGTTVFSWPFPRGARRRRGGRPSCISDRQPSDGARSFHGARPGGSPMGRVDSARPCFGEMASEMAHELNQPLTATLSFPLIPRRSGWLDTDRREADIETLNRLLVQAQGPGRPRRDGYSSATLRRFVGAGWSPVTERFDPRQLVEDAVTLGDRGGRDRNGGRPSASIARRNCQCVRVDGLQIQQMPDQRLAQWRLRLRNATAPAVVDLGAERPPGGGFEIVCCRPGPGCAARPGATTLQGLRHRPARRIGLGSRDRAASRWTPMAAPSRRADRPGGGCSVPNIVAG